MIKVACLNGQAWRGETLAPGTLPPKEADDFPLLATAAAQHGLQLEPRIWQDPTVATGGYDAVLIRACWDYTTQQEAFLAALDRLEAAGLRLFNPASVVRWNSCKTYLRDLATAGADVIDTIWLDAVTPRAVAKVFSDFDAAEIVLKPQVGAGSRETIRLKRNGWSEHDLLAGPQGPAMAQPFQPAIETDGEWSAFLFGGQRAHVIHKRPAPGDWYANVAGAHFAAAPPPPDLDALVPKALAGAPAGLLYARADFVRGTDGRLKLIELEAIEPYLFLTYAPSAADDLVRALAAALAG
jgi:hypothetical protein